MATIGRQAGERLAVVRRVASGAELGRCPPPPARQWMAGSGWPAVDGRQWMAGSGWPAVDGRQWMAGSGWPAVDGRQWMAGSGWPAVDGRQWMAGSGWPAVDGRQWMAGSGWPAVDGRQWMAGSGWPAVDGRQWMAGSGWPAVDGRQKACLLQRPHRVATVPKIGPGPRAVGSRSESGSMSRHRGVSRPAAKSDPGRGFVMGAGATGGHDRRTLSRCGSKCLSAASRFAEKNSKDRQRFAGGLCESVAIQANRSITFS